MKIKVVIGIAASVCAFNMRAQTTAEVETNRLVKLSEKLEGTYQVQIINSREKIAFPLSTLDVIESKRTKTDTVYFWLKERVRVMVLPSETLSNKTFTPLERITYINTK